MSKLPLRIAILECDTPFPGTREKYGGYGGVFKQMLERGADELKYPGLSSTEGLQLKAYNVVEQQYYPNLEDIDAILITGSKHDSFADIPWTNKLVEFVQTVLDQDRVKIVGVCYGHQIVGRALGAKVGRGTKGWEISVLPVNLSSKGKEIFKQDKLSLWQMHKDIVFEFPEGAEQLARTDICENQGMYCKGRYITVQGHPEFTRAIVEEVVKGRYAQGIFTEEMYKDAMRRAVDHDDGIVVAQAFLRFLLDD